MILVVDYGRGNLFSLGQALRHLGADYQVSGDPAALASAEKIVLPGVGAFGDAVNGLGERGLIAPLKEAVARGVPLLGICVGCQMLLSRGEEFGLHDGLDLIPGTVSKLPEMTQGDPSGTHIPNVGWRQLNVKAPGTILGAEGKNGFMYFVHSYAPRPERQSDIAATIQINGEEIAVAVRHENVTGVQFHPEKSGPDGLKLLDRFLKSGT